MKQRLTLESWLDACQNLYNQALDMRIKTFKETGKSLSYNMQAKMLTELRRQSTFWKQPHIDIQQDTLRCLDKAYDAFYRRLKAGENPGFPRFKGKGRYRSITFNHLAKQLIRTVNQKFARVENKRLSWPNITNTLPINAGISTTKPPTPFLTRLMWS